MTTYARVAATAAVIITAVAFGVVVATADVVALVDPILDTTIHTVIVLGSLALAALSWARFRAVADVASLYQASAFLLIGAFAGLTLLLRTLRMGGALGMDLEQPGQEPLYLSAAIRLAAVGLLLIGAIAAARAPLRGGPRYPRLILLAPTLAFVLALPVVRAVGPSLPPLIEGLTYESLTSGRKLVPALGAAPAFAVVQIATIALFAATAWLYARLYRHDRTILKAYLSVALVVGAVGEVAFTVSPGIWHGLVTADDAASAVAYIIVLLGAEAESRHDMRTLQEANREIRLMRDTYVERAALDERSRLAREIHDGLAQDLWFATLRLGRLASLADLPESARGLVTEISGSVDTALAEARQAVFALTAEANEEPLYHVLNRHIDEMGDRFGLLVETDIAHPLPVLSARAQAEILRIVQEAATNVIKHADATAVRLVVAMQGNALSVRLSDNGRGFDPRATLASSFGIRSMTQRAEALGGRLTVESADRDGTVVALEVPVPGTGGG